MGESWRGAVLVMALALLGCSNASSTDKAADEIRIAEMERRLTKLEGDALTASMMDHDVAYLRPSDSGYSLLDTDFGRMALSIENVRPYANGSQITLQIGNPTLARFDGVKMTVEWGQADKDGAPRDNSKHSMEHAITGDVRPGSWRTLTVNLADVPPTELGWVRISNFNSGSIYLARALNSE